MRFCVLLLLMVALFWGCGECDNSKYYQIRTADEDPSNKGMCQFTADGLGPCATWQKMQALHFSDSCKKFPLSRIVARDLILKASSNSGQTGH